jgi:hypothetical protein
MNFCERNSPGTSEFFTKHSLLISSVQLIHSSKEGLDFLQAGLRLVANVNPHILQMTFNLILGYSVSLLD